MLRKLNKGEELTDIELYEISNYYRLSFHAQKRYEERANGIDLRQAILNCVLAYYNTNGKINIALNDYDYIVFDPTNYKIITIAEKSKNSITIWEKHEMALKGINR